MGLSNPIILILMEGLSHNFKDPLFFDLKGSTQHRRTTPSSYSNFNSMPRDTIYKDVDFYSVGQIINLPSETASEIIRSLELDSKLFENYEVMDYSLLLIIETDKQKMNIEFNSIRSIKFEDYQMCIGIIDFLQSYSSMKKLHATINTLGGDYTKNSCVAPDLYRKRFLEMTKYIFSGVK